MPVLVRIEAKPFHLPRQIGTQGFRGQPHPRGNYGLYSYPVFAVLFSQRLGQITELRLGRFPHRPRCLRHNVIQKIFSGIVPVHRTHDIR